MIDREAFLISGVFLTVMLVAATWRVAMLPDWTLYSAIGGSTAAHTYHALRLFFAPLWLALFMGLIAIRGWVKRGTKDELYPWRRQGDLMLIFCGALVTASQLFMIARSLGLATTVDPLTISRAGFVLIGSLITVTGNHLPKMPWLQSRVKILSLSSEQGAKFLRFSGWLSVIAGVSIVICGALLPAKLIGPVMSVISFGVIGISVLRRMHLKREPLH